MPEDETRSPQDWDGGAEAQLTHHRSRRAGSWMAVRHEGFAGRRDSCADHGAGWEQALDRLAGYLAPAPARSKKR